MAYYAPTKLNDALDLMAAEETEVIAGCTDFYPSRSEGGYPRPLLDITGIDALNGIAESDAGFRIGAATTWSEICQANLPDAFAGLTAAAREVGSVQIQNAGTIGGNICNASPAADGVPPFLALDAEVEIVGPQGERRLPLEKFITGVRRNDLQPGELLTAVHVPTLPDHVKGAFQKIGSRKYLVISIVMTAVVIGTDSSGNINFARVAVGACSPVAKRMQALEAALIGQQPSEVKIDASFLSALSPITDVRGSADYRLEATAIQIARTIAEAV